VRRLLAITLATTLAAAACGSGPSPEAMERDQLPGATTTTEPPPEGVFIVSIRNGSLAPSNVNLNLETHWIVRWENNDPPREYVLTERNGLFESPVLEPGDSFEIDFSEFDPGLYRYHTEIGAQRIPGLIDTRPSR
jgi:hypothetical protein